MSEPSTLDHGIAAVLRNFPEVAAAWLVGSEARGEARPDSDVDIGLVFRKRGGVQAQFLRNRPPGSLTPSARFGRQPGRWQRSLIEHA